MPGPFNTYILLFIYDVDLCWTSSGSFPVKFILQVSQPWIGTEGHVARIGVLVFVHLSSWDLNPKVWSWSSGPHIRSRNQAISNLNIHSLMFARLLRGNVFGLNCHVDRLQPFSSCLITHSTGQNLYWKPRELHQNRVGGTNNKTMATMRGSMDVISVSWLAFFKTNVQCAFGKQ